MYCSTHDVSYTSSVSSCGCHKQTGHSFVASTETEPCSTCHGTGGTCGHGIKGVHYYCDAHSYVGENGNHTLTGNCSHGKATPHLIDS